MKVAVFGGSFNPLHKGHEAILRYLTENARFDKVLLVVTPQNPFKGAASPEEAEGRFRAAQDALKRHPEIKAEACDIELRLPPPQYTIRTLDILKERHPEDDFTLITGADCLESFPRWKDYKRILKEYGVAVYPRKGYHRGHLRSRLLKEDAAYKIELLHAQLVTISSTQIREAREKGDDLSKWLM